MTQTKPYKPYNARRRPSNIAPTLGYEACMSRYLITVDGVIFKVRTTPAADFSRWLKAVIALQHSSAWEVLSSLDYVSSVDRWYAINLLMESKLEVPLFLTFDQAQAVLSQGK